MAKRNKDEVLLHGITLARSFLTGLTQAHPTSLGLLIMAACTGGIVSTGDAEELKHVRKSLSNLYDGAQAVATAAAVAPVVSGGLGALGSFLEARKK